MAAATAAADDDDLARSLPVGVNRPEDQGAVADDVREEATYLSGTADDPGATSDEVLLYTSLLPFLFFSLR